MFDQKRDISSTSIQLMAQYVHYFNPESEFKLFFGIGPQISIRTYNIDGDDVNTSGDVYGYDKKRIDERYEFGLTANPGLEWFFMKNMSLHAEYGFYAYYYYDKYQRITIYGNLPNPDRIEDRKVESEGWGFDDVGALLGLSVYF